MVERHPEDVNAPRHASEGELNCARVLVVEDEKETARSMAELLQELGCQTAIATDGTAAIRKAADFHPNIVLLDIGLPNMDGYGVAQTLRGMPDLRSVLIVAITGYGETEDKKRAYEVGIDLHLTKPVKIAFLKELISVYGK